MVQAQQTDGVSIDGIKKLYSRAEGHSVYYNKENGESRNLEAFLMLCTLFEEVIKLLGLKLLSKRDDLSALRSTRKKHYSIEDAINDLYLLGKVSTKKFDELKQFKKDRNECIHKIFKKRNDDEVEKYTGQLFDKHKGAFDDMLTELEKVS